MSRVVWTPEAGWDPAVIDAIAPHRVQDGDPDDPHCDLCGGPMVCWWRGEECDVHRGDWNGETGNHLSCEERAA